jgi:hypothetical protein
MTSKAEELWEKHADDILYGEKMIPYNAFLAALREYGAEVRKRDAEIARNMMHDEMGNGHNMALEDCAAAIAREELP